MTNAEFIILVCKMREKQKEYFRNRDTNVMLEAKKLEREVDQSIKLLKDRQCHLPLKP